MTVEFRGISTIYENSFHEATACLNSVEFRRRVWRLGNKGNVCMKEPFSGNSLKMFQTSGQVILFSSDVSMKIRSVSLGGLFVEQLFLLL